MRQRTHRPVPSKSPIRRLAVAALAILALGMAVVVSLAAGKQSPAPIHATHATHSTSADGRPRVSDGFIAVGASISPFAGAPAIAKLEPLLRNAVQQAAIDARAAGVELRIDSGWRSARYQQALLDAAIASYGSVRVARQYVNTPQASTHVTGNAVDVGPTDADDWLVRHGSTYGLCRIYANELWHFELAVQPGSTCPPLVADASGG